MNLVPFLPEQLGLAEQPVHLLLVLARPEGQRTAKRKICFGLAAELAFPRSIPQGREIIAILRSTGFLQYLLVGKRYRAQGLFRLGFLAGFLGNVVLVNPRQDVFAVHDSLGCSLQPIASHGEIPSGSVHFYTGRAVLVALARHNAAQENMEA